MRDLRHSNFVINLNWLCSAQRSVSQICRDIGVNRQQFARYLSGESRPSAHVLRKVCDYFDTGAADLDQPAQVFQSGFSQKPTLPENALGGIGRIAQAMSPATRRFVGFYQCYYLSPSWPGEVVCSFCRLEARDGIVTVRSIERLRDRASDIRQTVKYRGFATYSRERLMIYESSNTDTPTLSETILQPPTPYQRAYMRGMTFGLSWRAGNMPFAAPCIWQALGETPEIRLALKRSGHLEEDSASLPLPVRKFFRAAPRPYLLTLNQLP